MKLNQGNDLGSGEEEGVHETEKTIQNPTMKDRLQIPVANSTILYIHWEKEKEASKTVVFEDVLVYVNVTSIITAELKESDRMHLKLECISNQNASHNPFTNNFPREHITPTHLLHTPFRPCLPKCLDETLLLIWMLPWHKTVNSQLTL